MKLRILSRNSFFLIPFSVLVQKAGRIRFMPCWILVQSEHQQPQLIFVFFLIPFFHFDPSVYIQKSGRVRFMPCWLLVQSEHQQRQNVIRTLLAQFVFAADNSFSTWYRIIVDKWKAGRGGAMPFSSRLVLIAHKQPIVCSPVINIILARTSISYVYRMQGYVDSCLWAK